MIRAESVFKAALVVCVIAWAVQAAQRDKYMPRQTKLDESDIDRLEKDLADPATRLAAIAALADFGGSKLYQVGSVFLIDSDPKRENLRKRAANLALMCNDIETISRALDSDDPRLHMWGLWFWAPDSGRPALKADHDSFKETGWYALTPKVRRLARDSVYRSLAIRRLADGSLSENREFLLSLIPAEKSAGVIFDILYYTYTPRIDEQSNRDQRFNEELLRLLADQDIEVRRDALAYIATNWHSAEMFQARFSAQVSQRVEELRKSEEAKEKELANYAAEGLEKMARKN